MINVCYLQKVYYNFSMKVNKVQTYQRRDSDTSLWCRL